MDDSLEVGVVVVTDFMRFIVLWVLVLSVHEHINPS